MNKIKVAVTGAAGQVGSALVRQMLKSPHIDAVAICRNPVSAGMLHYIAPGCRVRIGSITEADSARRLLGDCEVIINCALAMVKGKPKLSLSLNKAMIDNFLNSGSLKSLIHLSSISVYGNCIDNRRPSKSTFEKPRPDSDYGRSKLYIEQYAKRRCLAGQLSYYILRLGHVIGAKTDRSRELVEFAQDPHFRLPVDGDLPSNTIHVERLALMIIALLSKPLSSGSYNVADRQQTWRQVFNWHTNAIGLPPVKGMSPEMSERFSSLYRSSSITGDIGRWLRSLPILSLIRYPAVFECAYRLLTVAPPSLAGRLSTTYKRMEVGRQIAMVRNPGNGMIGPVYYSDAMPGTYLDIPSATGAGCPSPEELSSRLREWCQRFSQPRWLPDSLRK